MPQIAEEGTAQELLEQIKVKKQKLVKEGKLKKSSLNGSVIFRGGDSRYYEKIGEDTVCIDDEIPLIYQLIGHGYDLMIFALLFIEENHQNTV